MKWGSDTQRHLGEETSRQTASAKALKSVSVSLVPSRGLKRPRWLQLNDKGWEGIKQE